MPIPFMADPDLEATGLVRKPISGIDPPVALMLVRPREGATRIGMKLWDFAKTWITIAQDQPKPGASGPAAGAGRRGETG